MEHRRENDVNREVAERREEATSSEGLAEVEEKETTSPAQPGSESEGLAPDGTVEHPSHDSRIDIEGPVEK